MKNKSLILSLTSLLIVAGFFIGCKQKDTTPPKLYLAVDDPDSTILNSYYTIPIASADDNFDGTALSSSITVSHNIPMTQEDPITHDGYSKLASANLNDYKITYTVTDNAGLKTSRQLTTVVYNEFYKYAGYYKATKTSNENLSADYSETDGIYASLTADNKVNWRFSFPKLSNISALRIYGDVTVKYNATYPDVIDSLLIVIDMQEKSKLELNQSTQLNDTILYVVRGYDNDCHFTNIVNPQISIRYHIDKYKLATITTADYISGQDTTYGKYWKYINSTSNDDVTETYTSVSF